MSESESSDISSIDDREEDEEFRPLEVSEQLKGEYNSFAEFEKEFVAYQVATFQTYVKLRSDKLPASHALYSSIQYHKVVYRCVHHKTYKSKGSGTRQFLHRRNMIEIEQFTACPKKAREGD